MCIRDSIIRRAGENIAAAEVEACLQAHPLVAQVAVPVLDSDDESTLHERIKTSERDMLVEWVGRLAREDFHLDDRAVRLGGAPT